MPTSTSKRFPILDIVMSGKKSFMSDEARALATRASIDILWVHNGLLEKEVSIVEKHDNQRSRIIRGENRVYLLHAMFLSSSEAEPLQECGECGDVWISDTHIYYRNEVGWEVADVTILHGSKHPILTTRQLMLHPGHCFLVWVTRRSGRQHWDKWNVDTISSISHPGFQQFAGRPDIRAIIETMNWTTADIAHYLSVSLKLFTNRSAAAALSKLPVKTEIGNQLLNTAQSAHMSRAEDEVLQGADNALNAGTSALPIDIGEDGSDLPVQVSLSPSSLVTALAEGEPAQKAGDKGKQRETDVSVRDHSGSCTEDPAERPTNTSSSSGLTIQHEKHMQDDPSARLQGTQENSLPSHDSPTQGLFKQQALPLEGNKYKYTKETLNGAPLRQFKFFNGMIIGAAPQMDINGVTKETMAADEKMIELLSKGKDATAPSTYNGITYPPLVEELLVSSEEDASLEFDERIREISSNGRAVVLKGIKPQGRWAWSAESLGLLTTGQRGDTSFTFEWQSTQKRHEAHQKHRDPDDKEYSVSLTESGDMAKFLTAVKEGKDPLNCLDAPQPSGFAPSVINVLSDDAFAWSRTRTLGFFVPPIKSGDTKKEGMPIKDVNTAGKDVKGTREMNEGREVEEVEDDRLSELTASEPDEDEKNSVENVQAIPTDTDQKDTENSKQGSKKRKGRDFGENESRLKKKRTEEHTVQDSSTLQFENETNTGKSY
ncbi:hypothetical protein BC629DRAFT_1591418 [Irpex lacteus]|nr:hypothetical protein BC629DRAFT_1591418 [Irpex lacteus]